MALFSKVYLQIDMQQKVKTTGNTIFGVSLIVFGIAGMILPILPGWWVALIGLQILGWKLVVDRQKPWRQVVSFKNIFKEKYET